MVKKMANECVGSPPRTPGYQPYYCPTLEMNFQFFVDNDGTVYWMGVDDKEGRDISMWFTVAEVEGAFGWPRGTLKLGIGEF